jgi:hypothetical protein
LTVKIQQTVDNLAEYRPRLRFVEALPLQRAPSVLENEVHSARVLAVEHFNQADYVRMAEAPHIADLPLKSKKTRPIKPHRFGGNLTARFNVNREMHIRTRPPAKAASEDILVELSLRFRFTVADLRRLEPQNASASVAKHLREWINGKVVGTEFIREENADITFQGEVMERTEKEIVESTNMNLCGNV